MRDAVLDDTGTRIVPTAEAKRRGWIIAECAMCRRKAVRVDNAFPYHWEMNRCAKHLLEEAT